MQKIQKRTKIVATIGPRTESVEMMSKLVKAGLDVIRLNMSHGDHAEHSVRIKNARTVEKNLSITLPILLDLSGPKIRTGGYKTDTINIVAGKKIVLTSENIVGDVSSIYINYPKLASEVKKGSIIMLDDGKKKVAGYALHAPRPFSGRSCACPISRDAAGGPDRHRMAGRS